MKWDMVSAQWSWLIINTVQGINLKKYWFQNEAKCTTIHMEMSFIYIIIKNQFNINCKWPIECWILALSLLLLILHTCSTPLEITSFLFWSLTIPPPSRVPSTSSRECMGSMEIFWKWYLCNKILQEHLLDQLWELLLLVGSGKL